MLAAGDAHGEFAHLSGEILLVLEKSGFRGRVERSLRRPRAIHPERDADRIGTARSRTARVHADPIGAGCRQAPHRVHGVRQREPCLVIRRGHDRRRLDRSGLRATLGERGRDGARAEHRCARHALGRHHVPLGQERRQRQHVADVVEAVPEVVLREVVGRLQIEREQVADRVVVLGAVQAPDRDPPGVGGRGAVCACQPVVNPSGDRFDVGPGRALLVLGRHLARADLAGNLLPGVGVGGDRVVAFEAFQVQAALGLRGTVATVAMVREERLDAVGKSGTAAPCRHGGRSLDESEEQRRPKRQPHSHDARPPGRPGRRCDGGADLTPAAHSAHLARAHHLIPWVLVPWATTNAPHADRRRHHLAARRGPGARRTGSTNDASTESVRTVHPRLRFRGAAVRAARPRRRTADLEERHFPGHHPAVLGVCPCPVRRRRPRRR